MAASLTGQACDVAYWQVFGCRHDDAIHELRRPASEKRPIVLKNSVLKPTVIADSFVPSWREIKSMMGPRQVDQAPLFYEFSLERHVPAAHLLRAIDRFVDLSDVRSHLAPFYSSTGRPSIDPELLVRMLLVGYCYGIRSERRLCEEVHLNLAYRWFCRLGLDGEVPDHSTFSKIGMAASVTAICCESCSRPWSGAAWQKGWSRGPLLRSMPA